MAHQHPNLSVALTDESGRRKYVEFMSGYAEVNDSEVLRQLLTSPLRGPGKPHDFMFLATDEYVQGLIDKSDAREEHGVTEPGPYSESTLQDALIDVFTRKKNFILSYEQAVDYLTKGGWTSKSKNVGTIIRAALRELEKKGVLVARGNDWQAV